MGSTLDLVLTNIFKGFYESKWLNEYNLNKPKFYLRYVDEILQSWSKYFETLQYFSVDPIYHM